MALYVNEKENTVKFGEYQAKFSRIFSGKKYTFHAIVDPSINLSDAKYIAKKEKEMTGYDFRIIRVGNRYVVYIKKNKRSE